MSQISICRFKIHYREQLIKLVASIHDLSKSKLINFTLPCIFVSLLYFSSWCAYIFIHFCKTATVTCAGCRHTDVWLALPSLGQWLGERGGALSDLATAREWIPNEPPRMVIQRVRFLNQCKHGVSFGLRNSLVFNRPWWGWRSG